MQLLIVGLLVLASFANAEYVEKSGPAFIPAYGYIKNHAVPEAERIRQAEDNYLKSRIIGGVPAAQGQYPFKAGVLGDITGSTSTSVCGGSLVSANRVITAARCWFDGVTQIWRFTVVLGSVFIFSGGTRIESSAVVSHPSYVSSLARNDVAVIYLPLNVPLSGTITPIALPTGNQLFDNYAGEQAITIGYGITSDGGSITPSQSLNHLSVSVLSSTLCNLAFPLLVQSSNICTSGFGNIGTCGGDSGGPLIAFRNNRPLLIGVTSFGSGLGCEVGMPSIYSRVTSFMDFFNTHIIN